MTVRSLTAERAAAHRSAGWWHDATLAEVVADHAGRTPTAPAVTDARGTLTYADLAGRVEAAAAWLERATGPRDVVALQSRGSSDLLVLHLACSRTDRVLMPLSHVFTDAETAHLLEVSRATLFVAPDVDDRGVGPGPAQLHDRHQHLRLVGTPSGEGDFSLDEVLAGSGSVRPPDPSGYADHPHLAMISSGSTQLPKVSVWTDNDLWFLLAQFAARVDLVAEDTVLQIAPAGTGSTGYVFPVLAPVLFGAHAVLLHRWSPAAALDAISQHRATVATAVPAQMVKMTRLQLEEPRDVSSLRAFNNAGAKLGEEAARLLETTLGCRVQTSYGASDGGVPVLTSVHDDDHHRLGSVGRPLPGAELRLVDEHGVDQPAGTTGEVLWRTPSKTFGYLHDAAQDAIAFDADGWYRSGDLGAIDDAGYLTIVGRAREMIIRGGQNIHPGEVEDAVMRHPVVVEAAVIGLPDDVYGERAAAFVVATPGADLTLDALCAYLRDHGLATHKLPERLVVVPDLPHNNGGKVDKRALRASVTPG